MSALKYPGYYTIQEAADYLRVNERTIRNMIARGTLRVLVHFRPRRLLAEDVEGLLTTPAPCSAK